MNVSKVVIIVVALHVLVIGGIFIFEGCSRTKAPPPEMAENESPADSPANMPALPAPTGPETASTPSTPAPAVAPASGNTAARSYVVKAGDSLWKIAKSQNVTFTDLARANNLTKTSALKIGQKLQIPATALASATPASGETTTAAASTADSSAYTVKSGDSLWKIARSQNTTVAALKQANSLNSDALKVGQKLHVPTAAATTPTTTAANTTTTTTPTAPVSAGIATTSYTDWHEPGSATENGQQVHYVDIGESPAVIAKKYGIKVDELMKANNISDAKRIWVGERLIIPAAHATGDAATPATAPIVSAKS
jgi:LysM repeat protein